MKKICLSLLLMVGVSVFASDGPGGGGADKYGNTNTGACSKDYDDGAGVGGGGSKAADDSGSTAELSAAAEKAAQKTLPMVLDAGAGKVTCLEIFSDERIAAGYADGTVRVWNPAVAADALGHVVVLAGHTDYVTGLVVLNDDCIVTASVDGTIRVWDLKNDTVRVLTDHKDAVNCLIKLSDGRIASGSSDKTIRVWNLNSSENPSQDVVVLRGHTKEVNCLLELSNCQIVSASDDKTVRVWDLRGDSSFVLDDNCGAWDLYRLLDKRLVARTTYNVKVYDPNVIGDRPITKLSGRPNTFLELQDGRVISGTRNGTLEIFHAAALGDDAVTFQVQNNSVVNSLIELKNGLVAIGLGNGVIQVSSEFVSEKDPITFRGHTDSIWHLRELSGGCIVSGSSDGTIRIWPNDLEKKIQPESYEVSEAGGGGADKYGRTDTGAEPEDYDHGATSLCLGGEAGEDVSGGNDVDQGADSAGSPVDSGANRFTCKDKVFNDSEWLKMMTGFLSGRDSIQLGMASKRFKQAGLYGSRFARAAKIAQPIMVRLRHKRPVLNFAVKPDGTIVVVCSDGTVRIVNISGSSEEQVVFSGDRDSVAGAVVLSDGSIVVICTNGKYWLLNHANPGAKPSRFRPDRSRDPLFEEQSEDLIGIEYKGKALFAWGFAFSEKNPLVLSHDIGQETLVAALSGSRILAMNAGGAVQLWDLAVLGGNPVTLESGIQEINFARDLPDGRIILGSKDGVVLLWNPSVLGDNVVVLGKHEDAIVDVQILSDGRIVSASHDGVICVWPNEPYLMEKAARTQDPKDYLVDGSGVYDILFPHLAQTHKKAAEGVVESFSDGGGCESGGGGGSKDDAEAGGGGGSK